MSLQARQALVRNPRLFFQADSQRTDLLDENLTQTELVALLTELLAKGHIIELTAVRTDHSNDSCLGRHSHAQGFDADCWPLASAKAGDYLDASDGKFDLFLADAARSRWLWQVGLAGSAATHDAFVAAGRTVFADDGADHVHLGSDG